MVRWDRWEVKDHGSWETRMTREMDLTVKAEGETSDTEIGNSESGRTSFGWTRRQRRDTSLDETV